MKDFLNQRPAFFQPHQSVRRRREGHPARVPFFLCIVMMVLWLAVFAGMEYDYQMEKRRYRNKR